MGEAWPDQLVGGMACAGEETAHGCLARRRKKRPANLGSWAFSIGLLLLWVAVTAAAMSCCCGLCIWAKLGQNLGKRPNGSNVWADVASFSCMVQA